MHLKCWLPGKLLRESVPGVFTGATHIGTPHAHTPQIPDSPERSSINRDVQSSGASRSCHVGVGGNPPRSQMFDNCGLLISFQTVGH